MHSPMPPIKKLAELEAAGKVRAVITQNIDGLHQAAGSRTVLELHGSVPVSYTHLDVYKRQAMNSPRSGS